LPGLGNTTTGISLAGQYDIIAASRTSGAALILNRNTDDGDLIQFSRDGTTVGEIGVSGGNAYIEGGAGISGIQFGVGDIRPRYNGALVDGSAADIGHPSNRWQNLYLSGGVKFDGVTKLQNNAYIVGGNAAAGIRFNNSNDTLNNVIMNDDGTTWFRNGIYLGATSNPSSPNHLDDYEQGTWQLVFTGDSGITLTTGVYGKYVKVGKLVHISFYVYGSNSPTVPSGSCYVNLPFNADTGSPGQTYQAIIQGYSGGLTQNTIDASTNHRWQINSSNKALSYVGSWLSNPSYYELSGHGTYIAA
jgi:hypothetical protein